MFHCPAGRCVPVSLLLWVAVLCTSLHLTSMSWFFIPQGLLPCVVKEPAVVKHAQMLCAGAHYRRQDLPCGRAEWVGSHPAPHRHVRPRAGLVSEGLTVQQPAFQATLRVWSHREEDLYRWRPRRSRAYSRPSPGALLLLQLSPLAYCYVRWRISSAMNITELNGDFHGS
jgi:hypothetical protein